MPKSLHIVVLCWDKVIENVISITNSINNSKWNKTVIYATDMQLPLSDSWNWVAVDKELYYAQQFEEALIRTKEDILLVIVGDISHDNWEMAISTCIERYESDDRIGIWGATDPTSLWERPSVHISRIADGLDAVAQTDCSVWAMSRPIYERLREADYGQNKFGWGIDWMAICHGYSTGLISVRDRKVVVNHPAGTGYNEKLALKQMLVFIEQMTHLEKIYYGILTKFVLPIKPWGERPGAVD